MSRITDRRSPSTINVYTTGRRGPQGIKWINDPWDVGIEYSEFDALFYDGTSYRALSEHIAAPETEPGTGVDWETVWQVIALGSDVADVSTVAGIAAEIVAVAAVRDEVEAVAGIADEVQAVASVAVDVQALAPAVGDVQTAVANLPAIQAAPQAASDAADARDASQAWATGTEPGGPGTKSAREYSEQLGDVASAVAATESAKNDARTYAIAAENAAV